MKRKLFGRVLAGLVLVAFGSITSYCAAQEEPPVETSRTPLNSDITWEGTPFGVVPMLNEEATNYLERVRELKRDQADEPEKKKLVALLQVPECFVVAHVLLTDLYLREFEASARTWNHLQVELIGASVVIDDDQMALISALWKARFGQVSQDCESREEQPKHVRC